MTGGDLVYWVQEYFDDLANWQDANVLWLIGRTMIICFVLIWTYRIAHDIYKKLFRPVVRKIKSLWWKVSPFRAMERRRIRKEHESQELKYQEAERLRIEQQQAEVTAKEQRKIEVREEVQVMLEITDD